MVAPVNQQVMAPAQAPQRRQSKCESTSKLLKTVTICGLIGGLIGGLGSYHLLTKECPNQIRQIGRSMNHDLSRRSFVLNGGLIDCAHPPCEGTVHIHSGHCEELLFDRKGTELKVAVAMYSSAKKNGGKLPKEFKLSSLKDIVYDLHASTMRLFSQFSKEHPKYGRDLYDSAEKSRKSRGEFVPKPGTEDAIANMICRENAETVYADVEEPDHDKCIMHQVRDALCETDSISNDDICGEPKSNFTSYEFA